MTASGEPQDTETSDGTLRRLIVIGDLLWLAAAACILTAVNTTDQWHRSALDLLWVVGVATIVFTIVRVLVLTGIFRGRQRRLSIALPPRDR